MSSLAPKPSSPKPSSSSFASIAAASAHLPDTGATKKFVSLISRPLKEKKQKQTSYYTDPLEEWYTSSTDDEYSNVDDDDYPMNYNDEDLWQD